MAQNTSVDSLIKVYTNEFITGQKRALESANHNMAKSSKDLPENKKTRLWNTTGNGFKQYMQQHGSSDAISVGVPDLYTGGNLGLSISGSSLSVGMWDFGLIYSSHRELKGRIKQSEGIGLNEHFTHCAGIVMAQGINPLAKGMAYGASLDAFDADNDAAEMLAWAANGGTISNHSYGYICGWNLLNGSWVWYGDASVSTTEDYRFGLYTNDTKTWDNISYLNPEYIIVKSAGNDRVDVGNGSKPSDGPYDCIEPKATGKNTFVIGAVQSIANYDHPSDVILSTGSSWGPTDDGRIKPDFVMPGVNVISASASGSSAYATITGTSQAAANATGALALIQELSKNLYATTLKSATIKGLAIHTTQEAGRESGPDYSYGWGLLNVSNMARLMLADAKGLQGYSIDELNLNNGATYTTTIVSDGMNPIVATISWTDYQGTPPGNVLNPSNIMLVNDLDIKIEGPDGSSYYPWILDPANPANTATKGINNRDNVEKIEIDSPNQGIYTISINHKGTLSSLTNSKQGFSLIINTRSLNDDDIISSLEPNGLYFTDNKFQIFPIPFDDKLSFHLEESSSLNRVKIYNNLGILVYENSLTGIGSVQTFDVKNLPSGTYQMVVHTSNRIFKKNIIKY